jgi:hypothetical protein
MSMTRTSLYEAVCYSFSQMYSEVLVFHVHIKSKKFHFHLSVGSAVNVCQLILQLNLTLGMLTIFHFLAGISCLARAILSLYDILFTFHMI